MSGAYPNNAPDAWISSWWIPLSCGILAVKEVGSEDAVETLETLVQGKRLKDISDLPLDLSV